jgi:hypothetical protein
MTTHHVFLNKAYANEIALRRAEGVSTEEAYPVDLSQQPGTGPLWRLELAGEEPQFTRDPQQIERAMQSNRFNRLVEVQVVA